MRMTSQSESTLVPPVTAERSPPDSRMTGADSPVIADSSTDATPSTTSPSPGIRSPAVTEHEVAAPQLGRERPYRKSSVIAGIARAAWRGSACATSAERVRLRLAPPSAIASAKLANSTVNQSQSASWSVKPRSPRPVADVAHEHERREHAADQHHEHHRVPHHVARSRA